jgi:hypothetical protein
MVSTETMIIYAAIKEKVIGLSCGFLAVGKVIYKVG